jgi:predicted AlkP superfamily phosphohydrolase/phosphomutase
MTNRVLVIGIDGAPYYLIKSLVDKGKLPNIANLMKDGVSGPLISTLPPESACAWVSFATGKNPGKHGILKFAIYDPYTGNGQVMNSTYVHEITIWEILSLYGKVVGVINVPVTYPPKKINGFMISGFDTPPSSRNFTYPPGLASELDDYEIDVMGRGGYGFIGEDFKVDNSFIKTLYRITEKRSTITLSLMKKYSWDFLIVVFTGPDRLQHFFLTHHEIIEQYYQYLDKLISELLREVDEDTNVIIMSDHGFEEGPTKLVYINTFLKDLGLFYWKEINTATKLWYRFREFLFGLLSSLAKRGLDFNVLFKREIRKLVHSSLPPMDRMRTKAYFQPLTDRIHGININLDSIKGDKEYEILRDRIIDEICKLRDPETNELIIEKIFRREEIYNGPYAINVPDIIFILRKPYEAKPDPSVKLVSEKRVKAEYNVHGIEGIFIAKGDIIKKGGNIFTASILDIAPTILYLLNIPIPSDMDGRVLMEVIDPLYASSHSVQYQQVSERAKLRGYVEQPLSVEEERELFKRLKRLGYL